jgi:hypothetical protein
MKTFLHSRDGASKGAALIIVLALVVLSTGLALAYFSRTTADRQLAQSSYNDTSADLVARSALDIVVGDFKQEIINNQPITRSNIQPSPYPIPIPADIPNLIRYSSRNAAASRASNVSSVDPSANGRSITTTRWNSHYLVPLLLPNATPANSIPVSDFTAPDWVLVTAGGPTPSPAPGGVIGRYAFAVYDEGGLLDMSLAGYPNWENVSNCADPAPTPWLVNVGRKGIVAFADLTALGSNPPPQSQVDKIVGWRNYAMSQQPASFFPSGNPSFPADCNRQNWYGSYLLYFGDPPFTIESLLDKLGASIYPFTSVANYASPSPAPGASPPRTDQSLVTRQQLLKLRSTLGFSQSVLQYMGTFSRERNWPAPDWPNLNGTLSEGRFNLNNLALVVPNPGQCNVSHGKKKGWQTGHSRGHLCGTPTEIIELFGLFWVKAEVVNTDGKHPGYWKYIDHTGPNPPGDPDPDPHSIICFRAANQQEDFFQVLHYALNVARTEGGRRCAGPDRLPRTFGIGASMIDQYDSGADCTGQPINWGPGCDLDSHVNSQYRTHTTAIKYGQGGTNTAFAYGMEKNSSDDPVNGDAPCGSVATGNNPQRPSPAPNPIGGSGPNATIVMNHAFSNVGEFGYAIDASAVPTPTPGSCAPTPLPTTALPTLDFSSPNFYDAPILDFFSYNPISSAYPRAGIVNLYTRNAPVLAAMLSSAWKTEAASANPNPAASPAGRVLPAEAMTAANAIVTETQNVLRGSPGFGPVTQTDLTRAIAARLVAAGGSAVGSTTEEKNSIARALAEMGQTRTWNLLIDVIAQTGRYASDATSITQANKFIVEGEKRYWLHISLGRDLVKVDPTAGTIPCQPGDTGCQVDVLGSQLEEVVE